LKLACVLTVESSGFSQKFLSTWQGLK
jgi:hypothetical protein